MCIISILPKGTEKLTDETISFITNGYSNNGDGSGFMYKKLGENEVYLSKGYNDLQWLLQDIKDCNLSKDDELVIHHRIGNIGNKNDLNTHPFVCSFVEDDIHKIFGAKFDKPCLVHNGTLTNNAIYDFRVGNFNNSDTYAFARFIMSNIHIQNLLKSNLELFLKVMNPYLNTSKMCFLFPDRDLIKFGDFIEDNGYFHSNLGYKDGYYRDYGGVFKKKEEPKPLESLENKSTYPKADTYLKDYKIGIDKMLSKHNSLVLDGSYIRITDHNYMNFIYMKKDLNNIWYTKVFNFKSYDQKCLLNVLTFDNSNTLSVNEHALHTEYFFGPLNSVANYYREYLVLLRDLEPSKKVLKKLYAQLNNSRHKSDDFKVFHNRLGVYFTRGALLEYYNYFKEDYLKDPTELDYKYVKCPNPNLHISVTTDNKDEEKDDTIARAVTYDNTIKKEWNSVVNALN
jgi:predicted glutamine amidotransferase